MKINPVIEKALEATGLPYELRNGGQHIKIYVGDRLAGILPRNGKGEARTIKNTVAQIRRAALAGKENNHDD